MVKIPSFFLAIVFILFSRLGFSASRPVDSSLSKPHKLSQKEFLKKYGTDNSLKALIKYYFKKRKTLRNTALIYGVLGGTSFVIFNSIAQTNRDVAVTGIGILAVVLGTALALAAPIVVYRWLRTSRKTLFHMLSDYRKNKSLPETVRRSSSFQRFLNE